MFWTKKIIIIISKSKVHIWFQTHTYKIFKATDGGHWMKKRTLGGKGNRGAVRETPLPQQGMPRLRHWNTHYGPGCLPEGLTDAITSSNASTRQVE